MVKSPVSRAEVLPKLAEVFREFGFDGTTLAIITKRTGLGKGSLYNFFPGGKDEMAEAVLNHISVWFQTQIFVPLKDSQSPTEALRNMFRNVRLYFESGQRICIVGMFALDESRDRFGDQIEEFFASWRRAIEKTLRRAGLSRSSAENHAVDALVVIQGALVLARASSDTSVFRKSIARLQQAIETDINNHLR